MSAKPPLGRLETVEPRDIWESEATDFTPWLAEAENLQLLGNTIGITLELEAQEKDVGPFRADILCKDTLTDDWVLIENQLERTDHTHLGQIITYAAGLKAVTIVWVSRRFTEEHRAALDWLNEITGEQFRFFALEVEAWRIGDSPVAPKFNVVSRPNDWSRDVAGGASRIVHGELTDTRRLQLEFWTAFVTYVEDYARNLQPRRPRASHSMAFAIGRRGVRLVAVASTWDSALETYSNHELRVELLLGGTEAKGRFAQLEVHRSEIEAELGDSLEWHSDEGVQRCRIIKRRAADLEDRSVWPEYHAWLVERLDRLYEVFRPRLKDLDA